MSLLPYERNKDNQKISAKQERHCNLLLRVNKKHAQRGKKNHPRAHGDDSLL